jgi:hypothetical protein
VGRTYSQNFRVSPRAARVTVSLSGNQLALARELASGLRCPVSVIIRASLVSYLRRAGYQVSDSVYPNGRVPQEPAGYGGTD